MGPVIRRAYWHVLGMCMLLCLGWCCDDVGSICGARSPGDVFIGVLSSCHSKVDIKNQRLEPMEFKCSQFNLMSFMRTLAVIHTINTINNSSFLPGVKLGYVICDTCSDATKAIQASEYLLSINGTMSVHCHDSDRMPTKAIIGARYSEVSIAVARFLSLHMVPQISTTSSTDILSDKFRFPSFLRTIPSDQHQTRALARFMASFSWDWVGVVSGDDDYGKAALLSFLQDAEEAKVCLAFQKVLPHYLDHADLGQRIREVVEQIRNSRARVILLILKTELVEQLFQEMIAANISRTWVASDAWSRSKKIASMKGINSVGDIFGLSFITGQTPGFESFLQNLDTSPGASNDFIEEYKRLRFECTPELLKHKACLAENPPDLCPLPQTLLLKSPQACTFPDPLKANDDFLVRGVDLPLSYSERVATWAIAHALRKLLQCNATACSSVNFHPWKLLRELREVNFSLDNRNFYFDEDGNFKSGYDLIHWVKVADTRHFKVVGEYNLIKRDVEINEAIDWGNPTNEVPESKCSQDCLPGYAKKVSNISCCFNCTPCAEGTYSNQSICYNAVDSPHSVSDGWLLIAGC
ncbi:hypothetical protein GJAV_G00003050 [Gymnothorax javanicus]|nr:hypothetical protein GJAV_G00003050 [Gymnothorax javanicus]